MSLLVQKLQTTSYELVVSLIPYYFGGELPHRFIALQDGRYKVTADQCTSMIRVADSEYLRAYVVVASVVLCIRLRRAS